MRTISRNKLYQKLKRNIAKKLEEVSGLEKSEELLIS